MAAHSSRPGGQRYPRTARVNEVLREVVAETIERLADAEDALGMLTVTGVECSPDLRTATVFLSSMSDEAAVVLDERRIQLQREVATQVRLKRTPKLSFKVDPAVVHGAVVDDALRRLQQPEP